MAVAKNTRLSSFFYQQPGIRCPELPPELPIPGDDQGRNLDREAFEPHLLQRLTFSSLCKLARIAHEVSLEYHKPGFVLDETHPSLQFAEFKYRELLAWSESWPPVIAERRDASHHVITFQYVVYFPISRMCASLADNRLSVG